MASHARSKFRNVLIFKTFKANWKRRQKLQNMVAMPLMRQQTFITVLALISLVLYSSMKIATRMPRIRACRRKLRRIVGGSQFGMHIQINVLRKPLGYPKRRSGTFWTE